MLLLPYSNITSRIYVGRVSLHLNRKESLRIILWRAVEDNIRWQIVGSMLFCRCDVFAFDLRRSMSRPSKIDVFTFEDRCEIMLLHLLKTYANCAEGLHFSAFILMAERFLL